MGDDAIGVRTTRRSGCLKWTCGCLACLVVVLAITVAGAWFFFGRWSPGESAWERMPPETVWAFEAHDIRSLGESALEDAGLMALVQRSGYSIPRELFADAGLGREMTVEEMVAVYRNISSIYHFFIPNTVLVGGTSDQPEDGFLICKLPILIRWLFAPPEGSTIRLDSDSGDTLYAASHNGWLVMSQEKETITRLVENWDRNSAPFGPASHRRGAFVQFATYPNRILPSVQPPQDAPPENFMLGDPFAIATGSGSNDDSTVTASQAIRFLLQPGRDGWELFGQAHNREVIFTDDVFTASQKATELAPPGFVGSDIAEFELSVRLAPDVRESLLRVLEEYALEKISDTDPRHVLGWRWLREAWLESAGDAWIVAGNAPPVYGAGENPDSTLVAPIPQFAIGWTLGGTGDPHNTAVNFTKSLTLWLSSLKTPDRNPLRQSLWDTIEVRTDASGLDGVILPPAVPASNARPAWHFSLDAVPPMGWVATYPAGILEAGATGKPLFTSLDQPGTGDIHMAAGWAMGGSFIGSFQAWVEDRLKSMPPGGMAMDPAEVRTIMELGRIFFEAYPKGSVRVDGNVYAEDFVVRGTFPWGKRR